VSELQLRNADVTVLNLGSETGHTKIRLSLNSLFAQGNCWDGNLKQIATIVIQRYITYTAVKCC